MGGPQWLGLKYTQGGVVDTIVKLIRFAAALISAYLAVLAAWDAGADLLG